MWEGPELLLNNKEARSSFCGPEELPRPSSCDLTHARLLAVDCVTSAARAGLELGMDRWTALAPDRRATQHGPRITLIGRLPAEAYIVILSFLPIPDIPAFALSSRKLAEITRDDKLWRNKLALLDYRGPGAIPWHASHTSNANGAGAGSRGASLETRRIVPPVSPLYSAPLLDDDFGEFFEADGDVSQVHDDGFGEFQDFEGQGPPKANGTADPFGLGEFGALSVNGRGTAPKSKARAGGDDLMMLFDDEDSAPPQAQPSFTRPTVPSRLTFDTPPQPSSKRPPPRRQPTSPTSPSGLSSRSIFIAHHNLLLPYYLSFVTHTTSSLVFTSPTLSPESRAHLLASLVRFCSPLVAPTRSLPQRQTVLRNVQSGMDFFESALLAEFERADTRREEEAMKEKARILWELNASMSVVQVFVQKREIFYDQTHNPLRNLVYVNLLFRVYLGAR